MSELVMGLTVVSIGTSLPEMFVNVVSARSAVHDIGVGSIIGSCFGQMTLILGTCVLIGGSAVTSKRELARDGPIVFGVILLDMLLGRDGTYARWEGVLLMSLYVLYILLVLRSGREDTPHPRPDIGHYHVGPEEQAPVRILGSLFLGLLIVYGAAEVIVSRALFLGDHFHIPTTVTGVFTGTLAATPEFVVSLAALLRHSAPISIGNLIGSNITDPLFSLGLGSAIGNYAISFPLFLPSFIFWLSGTLLALVLLWTNSRIDRFDSIPLIGMYGLYVWHVLA